MKSVLPIPPSRDDIRGRLLILTAGYLVIAFGIGWLVWSSVGSGIVSVGFRHNVVWFTFARHDNETGFWGLIMAYLLVMFVALWVAVRNIHSVFFSKDAAGDTVSRKMVADLDRRAPSGLTPLWIALAIFVLASALYIAH